MTTKFSKAKAMKLPAVCHGSLVGLPPPYQEGLPPRLSCLAEWNDLVAPLYLLETFDLNFDSLLPGWSGNSSNEGDNLRVTVEILPTPNIYDITIILRNGVAEIDDASWHDIGIDKGPPFQSGDLEHEYLPSQSTDAVTLLD